MSRCVVQERFGGPEVLKVVDVEVPVPGAGQVRVRVAAAGLNPVDWGIAGSSEIAGMFGVSLPSGFGNDFAGVIDEVGLDVEGYQVGQRVFGGARGHAVADYIIIDVNPGAGRDEIYFTPTEVDDLSAATLHIAARTADATLDALGAQAGMTLLVGGAGGGVGVFIIQLAKLRGLRILGSGSAASAEFLQSLGAEPVTYGHGFVERVANLAPNGIDLIADLHGTDTAECGQYLGVPGDKITTTLAARDQRFVAVGATDAQANSLDTIAELIASGQVTVPIAATYTVERVREAVAVQAEGHVRGKIVITF